MFGRNKRERERKSTEALVSEIGAQRLAQRDLLERFEQEARVATNAVKAASVAREERDDYRRVLAAAIASERNQVAHAAELEARHKELELYARESARISGAAEAARDGLRERLVAVEEQQIDQTVRYEKELADAADRAWSEREAARGEVVQLITRSREEAAVLADEVRRALKRLGDRPPGPPLPPDDPSVSARRLRGRLMAGLAVAAMLIGVALTPAAFLSVIDKERAAFIHLVDGGATPWQLIIATVVSFVVAVVLLGGARRDLTPHR